MTTHRCGLLLSLFTAVALPLNAQVPDSPSSKPAAPAPASGATAKPKTSGAEPGKPTFLGKDVPVLDPGSDVLTWDGKSWNVNNNRIFQARFEKYLNAPEETSRDAAEYRAIISAILGRLAPQSLTDKNLMEAFRLLPKASSYDIDAHLCDSLADTIYSAWSALRANQQLADATEGMEAERARLERNLQITLEHTGLSNKKRPEPEKVQPYVQRLAEVNALMAANRTKNQLNKLQTKIEFQAFMVQLFVQRRFEHVLMATRFYRAIFNDGDTKLQVGKDAKDLLAMTSGMPPTVSTLDAMANEAVRDVRESVQAYEFLVKNHELAGGTKRLGEAFALGEYMPEIRTLTREKKRLALSFSQKSNQLMSALEARDFTRAEKLLAEIKAMAVDFDDSKAATTISTVNALVNLHMMKAKLAAEKGDNALFEAELAEATGMWPGNPKLAQFAEMIMEKSGLKEKSMQEFDRLFREKRYRQIIGDQVLMAVVGASGERMKELNKAMATMKIVESAIEKSRVLGNNGDAAGAWESVETAFQQFPDDTVLTQLRAELTTNAAEFVHTIRTAEEMEKKDQVGSSLAWYLKAKKMYSASEFAQHGMLRMVKKVLPDAEV